MPPFDPYYPQPGEAPDNYAPPLAPEAPQYPAAPAPGRGMLRPSPTPSGPNGAMGYLAAPVAGTFETLGQAGSAVQAGAQLVGATGLAQSAKDFAARQRETAATYESPDREQGAWYDPRTIAYQVLKGAPALGGMLAGGALAAAAAPEVGLAGAIGAGLASYPLAVGSNVQRTEQENGPLTGGDAAKALALGVPEAALNAWYGGKAVGMVGKVVEKAGGHAIAGAAASQAAVQGLASAGQDLIAQQMGDPNRPMPERMHEMIISALSGGVTGAVIGGSLHALSPTAHTPPPDVSNAQLKAATGEMLRLPFAVPEPTGPSSPVLPAHLIPMMPPKGVPASPVLPEVRPIQLPEPGGPASPVSPEVRPIQLPEPGGPASPASRPAFAVPEPTGPSSPVLPAHLIPMRPPEGAPASPVFPELRPIALPTLGPTLTLPRPVKTDQMASLGLPAPDERPALAPPNPAGTLALPAPPGAAEAPVHNGEPIAVSGPVGPPNGPIAAGGFSLPNRPFKDWTPEQIIKEASAVKETNPVKFRQLAYEAAFRANTDENATPRIGEPNVAIPVGNGMLLWPDGTLAPPNPRPAGRASTPEELGRIPAGWVRWPDGTYGPPNRRSPFDQAAATRNQTPAREAATEPAATEPAHPFADLKGDELKAAVKKAAGTSPKWLDTTNLEEAKASTQKAIDDAPVIRNAMEKVADALGMKAEKTPQAEAPAAAPAHPLTEAFAAAAQRAKEALDNLKAMKGRAASTEAGTKAFKNGLLRQQVDLNKFSTRIQNGGDIPLDYTVNGTPVSEKDEHPWEGKSSDKFTPAVKQAITDHQNAVEDMVNAAREAKNAGLARRAPRTPAQALDGSLNDLVDSGAESKQQYEHIAQNSSDPAMRTAARTLLKNGINPKSTRAAYEGGLNTSAEYGEQQGAYNPEQDTVHLPGTTDMQTNILHEGVHAGTVRAMRAGGDDAKAMQAHFDATKARSPGEKAYGLSDVYEHTAEAFANPEYQRLLKSQPVVPEVEKYLDATRKPANMWDAFKQIVTRMFKGAPAERNALDQVLELGNRLVDQNRSAPEITQNFLGEDRVGTGFARRTPKDDNDAVTSYAAHVDAAKERLAEAGSSIGGRLGKAVLGFREARRLVASVADHAPSATALFHSQEAEANYKNGWNKTLGVPHHDWLALPKADRDGLSKIGYAADLGIDARKPWEKQDPTILKAGNPEDVRRLHNDAARIWGGLSEQAKLAYLNRVDANHATALGAYTMAMHKVMKDQFETPLKGFEDDPAATFQMAAAAHDKPAVAKAAWLGALNKRVEGLKEQINAELMGFGMDAKQLATLRATASKGGSPETVAAKAALGKLDEDALNRYDTLDRWTKGAEAKVASLDNAPYFHASHGKGDYYVSGSLALDKTGFASKDAVAKVQARLQAEGLGDRVVDRANANPDVYIKVDTPAQAERLEKAFRELQAQGALAADTDKKKMISAGKATQIVDHGVGPAVMQDILASLRKARPEVPEGMSKETAKAMNAAWDRSIEDMTNDMMDLVSDSSPTKLMSKRKNVQGQIADLGQRSHEHDGSVAASLGRLGASSAKGEAMAGLRSEMAEMKHKGLSMADKDRVQNGVEEMMLRSAARPTSQPNGIINTATWLSRASVIGFNPAYFATIHMNELAFSVPELGKTHGMVNAFRELAKAEIPSIKVMRAMTGDPDWEFAGMRLSTLTKGGVSEKDAKFLTDLDNMGKMTHSANTNSMYNSEGDGLRAKAANMSTAMGRYAELQAKIKMALAARALYRGEAKDGPLLDFAAKKIDEAQFDYSSENRARQLTTRGALGPLTPVVNQFMSYRALATEKLYHEFHDLFSRGSTPEERKQAGKFLAGHLAAVAMISGVVGLPMAKVFASVYDKVADTLTGSPNHDIIASFRGHLADVFGHDAAVVMARGLPTLAGLDFSHLGEGDIAPGSSTLTFLTEKRKFEDAEKDWLQDMAGSSTGMMMHWALGMRDLYNGDYLRAAQKFVPEALKGPVEATQLYLHGYRDAKGGKLPITATPADIALTAAGLTPAKEAAFRDKQKTAMGLETREQIDKQNILQHLVRARMLGDVAGTQAWMAQSQRHREDFPGMKPPSAELRRAMQTEAKTQALGANLGLPGGVRPQDRTVKGMLRGL